jgi:hypothetical protein
MWDTIRSSLCLTLSTGVSGRVQADSYDETRIGLGAPAAWARYATVEAARLGTSALLRDDRILRVMIVRNEVPPAFVEWAER